MLHKGEQVGGAFKADIVVADQLILEIKSVAAILAVHEMQLRTCLRMSGIRVGLLLNSMRRVRRTAPAATLCSAMRPAFPPTRAAPTPPAPHRSLPNIHEKSP